MHRSIDKVHRNSEELAIRVFRDTKEIFRAGKRLNQANLIVARIERARQDRGISVAELARRINVDRKRLWYVLNGQRSMHVDEFVRLCAVMDMSLACFLTKEQASGGLRAGEPCGPFPILARRCRMDRAARHTAQTAALSALIALPCIFAPSAFPPPSPCPRHGEQSV